MVFSKGQRFNDFKVINSQAQSLLERDGVKLQIRDSKKITAQQASEEGFREELKYHYALLSCEKSGKYKPKKGSAAAEGRTPLKNKR